MTPGTQEQFGAKVTIDRLGMRQTDIETKSEKWLVLGDSSFFGHGLQDTETLHHHLETALRNNGQTIDVLCGATPGYSTLQTLDFLTEIGWDLEPSVLIIGNLWSDNNFDHFQDAQWMEELQSPKNKLIRLVKHSALFIHLTKLFRPDVFNPAKPEASPHAKISWVRDPYAEGVRRVPLDLYIQTLSQIIIEAKQRNIEVILIQPANRHRLDIVDVEVTWDPYFEAQRSIAEHFAIPIIDVAPILRVFGLRKSDAFLDDMHPTSQANFWIAQTIGDLWNDQQNEQQTWLPTRNTPPQLSITDRWSSMSTANHDTLP